MAPTPRRRATHALGMIMLQIDSGYRSSLRDAIKQTDILRVALEDLLREREAVAGLGRGTARLDDPTQPDAHPLPPPRPEDP